MKIKNKWIKIIGIIALFYIIIGIVLYLIQDQILFHPKPLPANYSFHFGQPFVEQNIRTADGSSLNIVQFKTNHRKGIILFFHGNMHNVEYYKKYVPFFTGLGYELWLMDYAGFGKSTGKRTEAILYEEAKTFYQLAVNMTTADSIIIYGKSIGTGVAAQLASVVSCKRLILETPYYNVPALAKHYFPIYPVFLISQYSLPTNENLKKIIVPVTLLHGTADEVIPFNQAKRLKSENPKVQLVQIPNGKHNNLLSFPVFRAVIDSLLR